MQKRITLILSFLIIAIYAINHFLIDWKSNTQQSAQRKIDQLVTAQYQDLLSWAEGEDANASFSKRTYCNGKLTEWSDDEYLISIPKMDTITVVSDGAGVYLIQKVVTASCVHISFHELRHNYTITNKYLNHEQSEWLHTATNAVSLSEHPFSYKGIFTYDLEVAPNRWLDAVVAILSLILIGWLYWQFGKQSYKAFLYATAVLVLLRILTLFLGLFPQLFRFPLFDSIYFTYHFFNPNLGDLLINILLQCLILLVFFRFYREKKLQNSWSVLVYVLLSWTACLQIWYVINGLLNNSQVIFDLSQSIHFDTIRLVAYICVILVCVVHFIYTLVLIKLVKYSEIRFWRYIYLLLFLSVALAFWNWFAGIFGFLHVFIIGLIATIGHKHSNYSFFREINSSVALLIAVMVGGALSYVIYSYEQQSDLEAKKKYANHLLLKRDILSEYYLGQVLNVVNKDSVIDSLVVQQDKMALLERLNKKYYVNPFFDKYQIDLEIGDISKINPDGNFLNEHENLVLKNQSDYGDVFFVEEQAKLKYVCRLVRDTKVCLIILNVKKRLPNKVYPAILTDSKFVTVVKDYDYAIFDEEELLYHKTRFGKIDWEQINALNDAKLFDRGVSLKGNHYFGIRSVDGRKILIASKTYGFRSHLVNFSFFFLLLLLCYWISLLSFSSLKQQTKLSFSGKIQLYMVFAFVFPLLTAGFLLLRTLNSSYQEELNRSYVKNASNVSEALFNKLSHLDKSEISAEKLSEISDYMQADVGYYDDKGLLVATSQPEIFNLKLKSKLIDPVVFDELETEGMQSVIVEQRIGNLDYKMCYAIVGSGASRESFGYVAMPFFESKRHMQVQQVEVFGNLIVVFGLIFIIISLLGDWAIKNLLQPLHLISNKMKQFNIQKVNEPIVYNSSDEIGTLIKGYNEMLVKLEKSKADLAKSQKETAWKEIAKQVAHEIKNPLMPMRLKIQQMMRRESVLDRDKKSLESMLEQIDTLSHIATSFSAFADMPALNRERFNWGEFVEQIASIYAGQEANIHFELDKSAFIYADKDIFKRITNNILLNALQARKPNERLEIEVKLTQQEEKAVLEIRDNGQGIPENIQDKVFVYQFTTKKEGSGIGLALAKKGVENAGGSIWFETKKDEGTSFFITMPLANS